MTDRVEQIWPQHLLELNARIRKLPEGPERCKLLMEFDLEAEKVGLGPKIYRPGDPEGQGLLYRLLTP
jgi:hypothetical protein